MPSVPETPVARIGITGQRGVLGSELQAYWPGVEWAPFPGDVEREDELFGWLRDSGPLQGIVHLAAIVPTQKVEADPVKAVRINVGGTCNLLCALHRLETPAPWLFVASSSHVYEPSPRPLREDSSLTPPTLYGLTKLQAEQWTATLGQRFGIPVCIGRIFSFTSPSQSLSYFVPSMIDRISKAPRGAELIVPGLHGTRDFITTRQISVAIQLLFRCKAQGAFNIGSGSPTKLLDLTHALQRRLGREDVIITPAESSEVHLVADIAKLKALGFISEESCEPIMNEMVR